MRRQLAATAMIALAGCSAFVSTPGPVGTGPDTLVILANDTAFKSGVIATVTESLEGRGYTVVTDDPGRADLYPAGQFGAVVYMAELWAWHVPWHQQRYHRENAGANNIVFVTTAGDPDVRITEPFDAITGASDMVRADEMSRAVLDRLDAILR